MENVHIGTSGWHYPDWRGRFYPNELSPDQWLRFYTQHFTCVEVNNTFYRLPEVRTLRAWQEWIPEGFSFAIKAPRTITHLKKLRNCESSLTEFLTRIKALGLDLGPVLFQLPSRWHCNVQRLNEFLQLLPNDLSYAFEFRDHTWHVPAVYEALEGQNVAFCIYDLEGYLTPLISTADLVYVRLHGPDQAYTGSYRPEVLNSWAGRIKTWHRKGKSIYLFFDNDRLAYAVKNARYLCHLLEPLPAQSAPTVS